MFTKLYQGELKKLIRPKALFILAAIIIIFLIIYGISYDFMVEVAQSGEIEDVQDGSIIDIFGARYQKQIYDESTVEGLIQIAENRIENLQTQRQDDILSRLDYDALYEEKSYLKALQYIQDKELYGVEIEIFSPNALFGVERSAQGFMQGFVSMLLSILLIYGVVLGSISYAEEMDQGTLKMLFMRPITRNKVTSAKLLALFSVMGGVFLLSILLAYSYALIRYGIGGGHSLIIVFNAMSVFKSTGGLALFITIMFSLLQVYAMAILGFALGTVIRKRTLAIIIGVILNLGIVSTLLSFLKLGRYLFTTSSNLGIYFGVTSIIPAGGNFFLATVLLVVYLAIFLAATYISFNKRDIA